MKFKCSNPRRPDGNKGCQSGSGRESMKVRIPFPPEIFRVIVVFLISLGLAVLAPAAGSASQKYLVYVGTYTDHGSKGIYAYRFDSSTGKMTSLGLAAETAQPSFFVVDASGRFLYAVNETGNFNGQTTGAVSAFAIQSDAGKLSLLNQVSSRGTDPAHITLDRTGKYALVANYTSGSVAVFAVLNDGRLGETT